MNNNAFHIFPDLNAIFTLHACSLLHISYNIALTCTGEGHGAYWGPHLVTTLYIDGKEVIYYRHVTTSAGSVHSVQVADVIELDPG